MSHQRKNLGAELIEVAARTLAEIKKEPLAEAVLQRHRADAQAVVLALLKRLAGKPKESGIFPVASNASNQILELADQVEALAVSSFLSS